MAGWGGFFVGGISWPWQYWVGYKGLLLVGPSVPLGLKHFFSSWLEGVGTEGATMTPTFQSIFCYIYIYIYIYLPLHLIHIYIYTHTQTPFDVLMSHFIYF